MRQREEIIKTWFDMWLGQELLPLDAVFTKDVHYYEFFGPEYEGVDQIRRWFEEWNEVNRVKKWDIRRFLHTPDSTLVEFYFQSINKNGEEREFEGVYLVEWDGENRIQKLQEFYCQLPHYKPFQNV